MLYQGSKWPLSYNFILTFILLEPKVISLCKYSKQPWGQAALPISSLNRKWSAFATSIEPVQPAHLCSLTKLYTVGWPTSGLHLDILKKLIKNSSKNGKWIIPFENFSRLRVNRLWANHFWLIDYKRNLMYFKCWSKIMHCTSLQNSWINSDFIIF